MKAIQFKILQRRFKFRNPNHWLDIPPDFQCGAEDRLEAEKYLAILHAKNIRYTFPTDKLYPKSFLKMKEPPLFLEFRGNPHWLNHDFLSVIGSREISPLTRQWMNQHLPIFLQKSEIGIVSGGARGVDQLAHLLSLKSTRPSVFVLPSGLENLYPDTLAGFETEEFASHVCFLSEFESKQRIHKSHFYFRNRLIAALGQATLVVQASLKSGSLLTVHHSLENGRPILVVPSHPEVPGFDGNLKLIREGAQMTMDGYDLLDFWNAEFHYK